MKRRMILFVMMALLMVPMFIFAANGDLTMPAWLTILCSIIALIIGIFVPKPASGKVWVDKNLILMVAKSLYAIVMAKKADSDGGKKITGDEWTTILANGEEGAEWLAGLLGKEAKELP